MSSPVKPRESHLLPRRQQPIARYYGLSLGTTKNDTHNRSVDLILLSRFGLARDVYYECPFTNCSKLMQKAGSSCCQILLLTEFQNQTRKLVGIVAHEAVFVKQIAADDIKSMGPSRRFDRSDKEFVIYRLRCE